MTKSNRNKVHLAPDGWVSRCGKRIRKYDYITEDINLLRNVAMDQWITLPLAAQCTRCRRGTGHRWATEEQIAAVEVALFGIAKVFA